MITIELNDAEKVLLYRQEPGTKSDGGWQQLMVKLQEITDEATGRIVIDQPLLERIQRYAFSYGNGGWESRLVGIFGRSLGPRLDQNLG
jgi:hypothetical protein